MLQLISYLKAQSVRLLSTKRTIRAITATGIFDELIKIKYDVKNSEIEKLDTYYEKIDLALASVK
jgi:V/A-type H+/Na+-transporting ATPase subunit A